MATAERLFAERGIAAVSGRQISEAAGQGNNAAVGYHFGTKNDLIQAVVHRHLEQVEQRRRRMLDHLGPQAAPRDWFACLVRPLTDHLASLGVPSWYARFSLQVSTDPVLGRTILDETRTAPGMARIAAGLGPTLAALPGGVREQRLRMIRYLIAHTCAEHEGVLAEAAKPGAGGGGADWDPVARLLVDAVSGLLLAPVSVDR
ncbi:TetR/AcrR family transcriptional regulator [Actinospica robiniae]|uniref:TetR/AcrR family transcriptional regulator n=1 Tax=Actinospica robiniae TaxID=304901 RepID=UPI00040BEBAF|nr:helix-turn-helix domain-containing protein [Actinospica robiniae]